jgi:hypothetical protein
MGPEDSVLFAVLMSSFQRQRATTSLRKAALDPINGQKRSTQNPSFLSSAVYAIASFAFVALR